MINGLKDIALTEDVPMIAIVAADKEGLKASRLRNYHLRGSSAINYEADIILILNEKYQIVAKVNIEFNPYQAQRFRDWVIVSVEKNRGGQDDVDLEFEKHFEFSCFDPNGRRCRRSSSRSASTTIRAGGGSAATAASSPSPGPPPRARPCVADLGLKPGLVRPSARPRDRPSRWRRWGVSSEAVRRSFSD